MNMQNLVLALFFLLLPSQVWAQSLSESQAVEIAKRFIFENGYTNATEKDLKLNLDHESLERSLSRDEILKNRHNTLKPDPIGAKKGAKGRQGWSIAFDYVESNNSSKEPICRVVTMNLDGNDIRVEHVDGLRGFFEGFSEKE